MSTWTTSRPRPDDQPGERTADRPTERPTDQPHALAAAKPPVGTGASPLVAQLLALGLVALGVAGVQDMLARTGLIEQQPWSEVVLERLDGLAADSAVVLVAGIASVVLGLLLLPVALRRRPRRALELEAGTGVRLRTGDLARLVRADMETVDGVVEVDVRASRRTLTVRANSVAGEERHAELRDEIERRAGETCAALERAPRPRVKLKEVTS